MRVVCRKGLNQRARTERSTDGVLHTPYGKDGTRKKNNNSSNNNDNKIKHPHKMKLNLAGKWMFAFGLVDEVVVFLFGVVVVVIG